MTPARLLSSLAVCAVFMAPAHAQFYGNLHPTVPGSIVKEPCRIGTGCTMQIDQDFNQKVENAVAQSSVETGVREPVWGGAALPGSAVGSAELPDSASGQATPADIAKIAATYSGQLLGGDEGLACEALLCLAAGGSAPSECARSLARYYAIVFKRWSRTVKARQDFLNQCPVSNEGEMPSFVDAVTNGAGVCDVNSLNQLTTTGASDASDGISFISHVMPGNCDSYYGHALVGQAKPRYVGTPDARGFWVAAEAYDAALVRYEADQKKAIENALPKHENAGS